MKRLKPKKHAFRETVKFLLSEVKQPERKKLKQLIRSIRSGEKELRLS
jgi:hypothetical protein